MAAAKVTSDEFEDLLTCTICQEIFKTPKYLPCLHTFCESCLNTYILSTVDTEKDGGFKCPVCRTPVTPDSTAGTPDTWVHQFPGNHFIKSMMDRRSMQKAEKLCDSCQMNSDTKSALSYCTVCQEAFCSSCEKCHKSFKMTAKHRIISIKDIAAGSTYYVEPLPMCEEHHDEVCKAYCVDHAKPLCTLCATLSHRKCDNVMSIANAAAGIKQSSQTAELLKHLTETSKQLSDVIQDRKENLSTFEKDTETIQIKINTLKAEIIKHITSIAEQLKQELETSKKQTILQLAEDETELSSMKSTVDNWITILNNCLKHGSEQQLLLEIDKIKSKKSKLQDEMDKSISGMKYAAVRLETNHFVEDFRNKIPSFGNVKIDHSGIKSSMLPCFPKVDFKTERINIVRTIQLSIGKNCGLFLKDVMIFTEYFPSKVLKYNYEGYFQSELELPSAPTDIAVMDDHRAAVPGYPTDIADMDDHSAEVASLEASSLYIINTTDMTLIQTLNVSTNHHGLTYVNGEFISAFDTRLTWINATSGAVIDTKTTNGLLFYIYASDRDDYIYDDGWHSVTRMVKGSKSFTYTSGKLSIPTGIDTDVDGNIYICGFGSFNVHQLTKDGKLIRIIPATSFGIIVPWVLRFSKNSNKFFITCLSTGKVAICEIV